MITEICATATTYIIEKTDKRNRGLKFDECVFMTSKRLQKLLFFCDVQYMLEHNGMPMFPDEYYAWPSGPVIPSIYQSHTEYEYGYSNLIGREGWRSQLTPDMQHTIDEVFDATIKMDTAELIKLSHDEKGPWWNAYSENDLEHKQLIPKDLIYAYYKEYPKHHNGRLFS